MQGFFTTSAKNVAGGIQQLAAADTGRVRGQRRQVGRDGLLQQLRVQAGVLGLDHHGAGNGMSAGQEKCTSCIMGAISTSARSLRLVRFWMTSAGRVNRAVRVSAAPAGDTGVVLKGDIRPEIRQVADRAR